MIGVMYQINLVDFGDCGGFILNVKSWTLVSKVEHWMIYIFR